MFLFCFRRVETSTTDYTIQNVAFSSTLCPCFENFLFTDLDCFSLEAPLSFSSSTLWLLAVAHKECWVIDLSWAVFDWPPSRAEYSDTMDKFDCQEQYWRSGAMPCEQISWFCCYMCKTIGFIIIFFLIQNGWLVIQWNTDVHILSEICSNLLELSKCQRHC